MTTVPIHPEAVPGDAAALRWVVPGGMLPFVGAVSVMPEPLQEVVDDGTVDHIIVEPCAVRISLAPGMSWRSEGNRIRTALQEALETPEHWGPETASSPDAVLRMAVDDVIRGDVGNYIRSHGGVVEVVDVDDGRVQLSLTGACSHCPASDLTLTDRIETAVRSRFPALREVVTQGDRGVAGGRRLLGIVPTRRSAR